MITIALFEREVKLEFVEAAEAAHAIEAEIEAVLELVNLDQIDTRDAAARLDVLYAQLHQVSDGPRWDDFIPFDGSVVPPELADDGLPVCEWPRMYMEVN